MPETEKYVTPDQMRDVVERINRGIPVDPASVNIGLSLSGQTLTLTKPDGTVEAVELPSGGESPATAAFAPLRTPNGAYALETAFDTTNLHKSDVIILQPWRADLIPAIKEANPRAKVFAYQELAAASVDSSPGIQPQVIDYSDLQAHPEWQIKTADGTVVDWGTQYPYLRPFDPGNDALIALAKTRIIEHLGTAEWDGVFFDDLLCDKSAHTEYKTGTATQVTSAIDYLPAFSKALRVLSPWLRQHGLLVAGNAMQSWGTWDHLTTWAPYLDATMIEYFTAWDSMGTSPYPDAAYSDAPRFTWRVDEMRAIQSCGSAVWATDYMTAADLRAQRMARALFLLGWDGGALGATIFQPIPNNGDHYLAGLWVYPGQPVGEYTTPVAGLLARTYTGGVVYINPTPSPITYGGRTIPAYDAFIG